MYFDGRLWAMMAGVRWRVAAAVALGLVAMGVGILRFVFLGRMLALVFNGAPVRSIAGAAAATAACVLLRAWLDHRRTVLAQHTAGQVQARLRARLFDRIAALGPAWFSGERTGGVMLAVVDGVEQLQTFFGVYLPQLVIAACAPVMIFAVLAWWDVPTAAILLAGALVTLALPQLVHRADRRAALARSAAFNAFGEEFLDAVQGLPTLKAFGQGAAFGEKLARKARALSDSTFWVLALGLLTRFFTDLGTGLGAAAAIAVGAWRVRHGDMSLEALLIVLMAGSEIFRPLRDLRGVLHQGMIGQSAANAIHALLDAPGTAPAAAPRVTGLRPELVFDGVRFAYPGRRADAHAALSFAVREGETVAIVGPSGAGKSTIVRLLLRQHDAQGGAIRIGGHDVRALDPDQVREMIAVVAQDATLFDGSVADNLRLGRPDASDADMIAAARAANAHDFIMALPDGYATRIGERGLMLSGGQRQRIAIARALLRDAPILLLDEALSSVDAENEALIQQALDRLTRGRTTLVLAHRLSSVIGADRILVLDQGQVVDTGTHAALIARDGPYRRLMGPQLEAAADAVGAAATAGAAARASAGPQVRPLDDDAATIGWPETLRTLLRFVRPWKGKVALTVLCGIGRVLGFIGVGVIGARVVGAVSAGQPSAALVAALLAVAPLAAVLHWLESWLAHDMAYRLLAEMRIALFATLERLAPAGLLRRRSGDLVALATQDVETVEYFYAHTLAPAFVALLVPAGVLALLASVAWPLAVVLLPFLLWAGLAPVLARRDVDRLGSRARDALGQLGAHLTETIQGLAELTAFQALARRREAFVAEVDAYGKQRAKLLDDLSAQSAALEIASGLGGLAVAALGALLCAHGGFPREALPLLVLVAVAAFMPVAEIGQVARQLADTIASTRRLRALEKEPVTVVDGTQAMPGHPTVRFEETRFTYPGRGVPAIDRVSFDVPPGSTVALVGPSGAGKSTVASLLLRFWDPQHGRVTLGGVDLRDLRLDDLRQHIALVAQDTYLFNDTLEANIRLAANDASAADVQRAIDHAALGEFVARLPDGLATRVGERGVQLSGGQRQRVAIARAFLKDAPVLILDEATSHLDTISEQQIRAALEGLMAQRTSIIIAHRLSTVRNADLILVIEHGKVVEAGRHAELMARQGAYARLVAHQASGIAA
ncbi:ABC transporter ATP-binding protein/permease [Burkholderia stagnalis]|uniref:ABC transporter ATP-binding protein n=1 Tax=Burkholderia stagnalis TaxID=1503054 RepID=A0ABX9YLW8_9BURK|nr:ABC transporter ATP-binding protein [Burkholderia stagnalis]RQQ57279.1 ABC transporter ATP-binding protein [Burkholderia stagnalis]RQQ66342.1 ABC transporter ATP-binding protein [Burkholderia stagnalis]RQQ68309.1 ABC transporter ATP-binding protein [Burkholderia stagnalis]RQQ78953.1 ABC transporter ATP-binding protein [Burkholderia stagnalis]RQQ88182.1 ABC transporter ATP-binding protein [Burkholderia stagnalis]